MFCWSPNFNVNFLSHLPFLFVLLSYIDGHFWFLGEFLCPAVFLSVIKFRFSSCLWHFVRQYLSFPFVYPFVRPRVCLSNFPLKLEWKGVGPEATLENKGWVGDNSKFFSLEGWGSPIISISIDIPNKKKKGKKRQLFSSPKIQT